MTRAVLDTNIFVSALLQPQGIPAEIFLLAITGALVQLCMSGAIYAEYEEVIRRPKLKRSQKQIERALESVRDKALWVRPRTKLQVCVDPDDDIFLECAEASQAHYLVTGNLKHFPPTWVGTRVVNARQMWEALAEGQSNAESTHPT
jgi:uncharacterized protein